MLNWTPLADAPLEPDEPAAPPEPVLVSVTFERSGTSARRESRRATLSYENAVPWITKPCAAGPPGTAAAVVLGAVIVSDKRVTSLGTTSETSRSTRSQAIRCDRFVLTAESHVASWPVTAGGGTIGVIGALGFAGFGVALLLHGELRELEPRLGQPRLLRVRLAVRGQERAAERDHHDHAERGADDDRRDPRGGCSSRSGTRAGEG